MPKNKPSRPPSRAEQLKALLDGPPVPMTTEQQALLPAMIAKVTDVMSRAALEAASTHYRTSGNPSYLFDGLETANRARMPIPGWILDPLTLAAKKMSENPTLTLDAALGYARKQGQRSRDAARTQSERDAWLKWLIEECPRVVAQLAADPRLAWYFQEYPDLLKMQPKVSGADGAAEHALKVLRAEGDTTYDDVDSLTQRYRRTLKDKPSR